MKPYFSINTEQDLQNSINEMSISSHFHFERSSSSAENPPSPRLKGDAETLLCRSGDVGGGGCAGWLTAREALMGRDDERE